MLLFSIKHMEGIHVALSAERLTEIAGIPITNTLITSWVVIFLLVGLALVVGRNIKIVPGKTQLLFETVFDYILNYMTETLESKRLAEKFFPFITTLFLFILFANWLEFTPGIGSVGFFHEGGHGEGFTPLLRSVNTDLNVTLALAIISFLTIEITGIFVVGVLKYWKKFVNLKSVLGFFKIGRAHV